MAKRPALPPGLEAEVRSFRRSLRGVTRFLATLTRMLQDSLKIPTTEIHLLIHLHEWSLLRADHPSAADLCEELRLDKGAMSRALAGLEKRGYLSRAVSPEDHRRQFIKLTRAGRELARLLDHEAQQWDGDSLVRMPAKERQEMLLGLNHLHQLFLSSDKDILTEGEQLAERVRERMRRGGTAEPE